MAKKTSRKKKKTRTSGKLKPFLWGFFFCLILSVTLAATTYFVFLTPGTRQPPAVSRPTTAPASPAYSASGQPHYEEDIIPEIVNLQPEHIKTRIKQHTTTKPKVAIIIDDMGYSNQIGKDLIELDMGLSFAFLPFLKHTHSLMNLADQHGTDILLHLPMEASSKKWDPGPGSIYTSMDRNTIIRQVKKDLQDIPKAIGVNNHMGSRFTSDRQSMLAALVPVKQQSLFFIDSMTSSKSVAFATAQELGIPTGRRDIFLDNEQNNAKIKAQLEKLVRQARKNGTAIGIAHPHPATLATLKKEQWWLKNQVEIVRISILISRR
jgi:polysaccharide deacetylase 2 family uncharacterized protein YibQ